MSGSKATGFDSNMSLDRTLFSRWNSPLGSKIVETSSNFYKINYPEHFPLFAQQTNN